jgi:2-amino-4-hydroxy-6-hydroxymethyldihydropteridine diphosphokinase
MGMSGGDFETTHAWIATRHYPYRAKKQRCNGHDALIALGGNIGDTVGRFERLFVYWRTGAQVRIIQTSLIFRNPPFGYADQPDFYNAVMQVCTHLDPHALLRYILYTEKRFGRTRPFPNAPRTLDLDLIFYAQRAVNSSRLRVPHPHWHERDWVVEPLKQLKGTPW